VLFRRQALGDADEHGVRNHRPGLDIDVYLDTRHLMAFGARTAWRWQRQAGG
jgi:hypothetical protein